MPLTHAEPGKGKHDSGGDNPQPHPSGSPGPRVQPHRSGGSSFHECGKTKLQ